ncbi:MAG TPA: efflux RND transporter periplasmic adaptor subunit [Phycisphaerae bacterium]|nr:efflux RND transporter periplasmic adaptor subunit [Phycisphaerae bacterium]
MHGRDVKTDPPHDSPPSGRSIGQWLLSGVRLVLVVALLAGGVAVAMYLLRNKPKAQRRQAGPTATLVQVHPVEVIRHRVIVQAMGTVQPARRVVLSPRVVGQVVDVGRQFLPGGQFDANEPIVSIDPADFHLAVLTQETEVQRRAAELDRYRSDAKQRAAEVIRAECTVQIEMGQQAVAQSEYELLGRTLGGGDQALVLREPQLKIVQAAAAAAKAALAAAEATAKAAEESKAAAETALAKARLDLARTTVRAPFNAMVVQKSIDVGSQVSTVTPLATLVGTDEYWVEVSVPVDELRWLQVPRDANQPGSPVKISYGAAWGAGASRDGRVLRLTAELEAQGRMARLLVEVADPLCRDPAHAGLSAMILGAYVRVEIDGRELPDVAAVPRPALRDGRRVWIMTPENTLEFRPVEIVRRAEDRVYVTGSLRAGERLIVSDLGAPVEGMALRELRVPTTAAAPAPGGAAAEAGRAARD